MQTARMSNLFRRVTRGVAAERLAELADRELVGRLLAGPDEAAFEALVRRHGPMVYRVCWRLLQHAQDCEDAFQATFLLLARKLPTVKKRDSLASWLHGVAHRVASNARTQAARRRRHERNAPAPHAGPPDEITWGELRAVLDAELGGLPERLRLPLVLCYLEGRSQEEAARQLGSSKSTLLRRLREAREALRRRLTRKGVVWPAALSAVLLSECVAPAALAPKLIDSTVRAAACALAGCTAAGVVSANVTTLAEGVLKAMFTRTMKSVVAALALAGALLSGAAALFGPFGQGLAGWRPPPSLAAAQPPKSDALKAPPGVPLASRKPVVARDDAQVRQVAWAADGKVLALSATYELVETTDDDGENPQKVLVPRNAVKLWDARTGKLVKALGAEKETALLSLALSPDKKLVAVRGMAGMRFTKKRSDNPQVRPFVKILDAETGAVKLELGGDDLHGVGSALAFSPDGKTLALGGGSPLADKGAVVMLWDLERKKLTTVAKIAAGPKGPFEAPPPKERPPEFWMVVSLAFSPDGKIVAAGEFANGGKRARVQLYDAGTGAPKRAWEIGEWKGMLDVAFTADGKSVVSASGPVKFWEASTGKERRTLDTGAAESFRVAVSPDGKYLATCGRREEKDRFSYEVCLWGARTGELVRRVSWKNPSMYGTSIAFSRDGTSLAVGAQTDADGRIKGSEKVRGELRIIPLGR